MLFKTYFFGLDAQERKDFAREVGTSVGHLTNFSYGYTVLKPAVCVAVERKSGGEVTRQELRADDWRDIWPELIDILPDRQKAIHIKQAATPEEVFLSLADGLALQDRRVTQQPFTGPDRRQADSSAAGKGA